MRIVFASLGSLGDLHPLLALARAAGERGHETVIAASKDYRAYVGSLGFEFQPIRPDFTFDTALVGHLFHPRRGPERLMREQVFPSVRETYADLLAAARGADFLVVGELLYVAPLVAAKLGIPWANAILAPTSFLSACDPCVQDICDEDPFCCFGQWDSICQEEVGEICGTPCPGCGNGIVEGSETCDGLAGCPAGETCDGTCSTCAVVCGDGVVGGGETCEFDGNVGCTAGSYCNGSCSGCDTFCGDNITAGTEVCDGSTGCPGAQLCNGTCSACNACPTATVIPARRSSLAMAWVTRLFLSSKLPAQPTQ